MAHLFVTPGKEIFEVEVFAADGSVEVIGTTAEHPFWVAGEDWVEAGKLRSGDELSPVDGGEAIHVAAVRRTGRRETVYNFEVEEAHTYFVGASGVWVHNLCDEGKAQLLENLAESRRVRQAVEGSGLSSYLKNDRIFQRFRDEVRADQSKGPFVVSQTGLVATEAGIQRLQRAHRAVFQGLEIRAVRDLSHLSDSTLEVMAKKGFAAKDSSGEPLVLHHLNQNPAGPLVEIPASQHSISNRVQHPLGNTPGSGLSTGQRESFNQWRKEYWKARAIEEINRRR